MRHFCTPSNQLLSYGIGQHSVVCHWLSCVCPYSCCIYREVCTCRCPQCIGRLISFLEPPSDFLFFVELWGGFSSEGTHEAHIQLHHPYTNVIGLGDSSSWRVPFFDRITYLFIAPLFLPLFNTPIGVTLLAGRWWSIAKLLCVASAGYFIHFCMFHYVAGLSLSGSILCMVSTRSVLAIPYIHVNIFQHIGLPMYDIKNRPKRLHQLASAALNLPRNPLLDYSFGHSIVSCHVEHHLFPRLSDNMCLKIKPLVSSYLKNNGLPYNEATYIAQLTKFYKEYDELMVKAPPITELIGIQ